LVVWIDRDNLLLRDFEPYVIICNSIGLFNENSIHDGPLLQHKYSTLQLSSITCSLSTLQQYLSEQAFYSSFAVRRVSQETPPTGRSQAGFSTQLQTALSSSLPRCPLALGHQNALHCDLYSLLVQISLPQMSSISSLPHVLMNVVINLTIVTWSFAVERLWALWNKFLWNSFLSFFNCDMQNCWKREPVY
jgi:hypothetical protein